MESSGDNTCFRDRKALKVTMKRNENILKELLREGKWKALTLLKVCKWQGIECFFKAVHKSSIPWTAHTGKCRLCHSDWKSIIGDNSDSERLLTF